MPLLNAPEFERRSEDFFTASYLNSVGIIQNVALGLLATKFFGAPVTELLLLQAPGSFLVIILIVEEYHWWLILVRRTPTFVDAAIPYVLGAAELSAIEFVDGANGTWLIAISTLAVFGIMSLINSRAYCTTDVFQECPWLQRRAQRNLEIGMVLVSVMLLDLLITRLLWTHLPTWALRIGFAMLYALIITMITVSARFLRSVREEFERIAQAPANPT